MERDRERFLKEAQSLMKKHKRIERTEGVIGGFLIGLAIGGHSGLGMPSEPAIGLGLVGVSFGLAGAGEVLNRQRLEKVIEDVLKKPLRW